MKTATIRFGHLYGTRGEYVASVIYRGKVLKAFYRNDLEPWEPVSHLKVKAKAWAACNGFTHYKFIPGVEQ